MLLLGIETATDVCGVALMDGDALVAEAALHLPRVHASHLAPLVADVLRHAGRRPEELAAVAVSSGPGSFTGLRIGVSTAKGLCAATGAALIGVPTLAALAAAAEGWAAPGDRVVAAMPSRRGQAFCAVGAGGAPRALELEALAAEPGLLLDGTGTGTVWIVGPAAEGVAEALVRGGLTGVRAMPVAPSAARVAGLGWARFRDGAVEDLGAFEPDYVAPAYVGASPFVPGAGAGTAGGPGLS